MKNMLLGCLKERETFVSNALLQVQQGKGPAFSPAPPMPRISQEDITIVEPCCTACGLSLHDEMVVGVCMLPCKHPYHIFCFATLCICNDVCLVVECGQEIPHAVKMMFGAKTTAVAETHAKKPDPPGMC